MLAAGAAALAPPLLAQTPATAPARQAQPMPQPATPPAPSGPPAAAAPVQETPAVPAPPPVATPAPQPSAPGTPPPETPPATAQTPPARPADVVESAGFGDEVTLTARPALVLSGRATWDDLYGTFRRTLEQLNGLARAQGVVAAGPPMIRFVSSTDEQADYEAILPVVTLSQAPERYLPARPGTTPAGQAYRFVHFGGYDTMEQTYDEITNFLDERSIQAEDSFVEEYVRDPETTSEVDLATFIYVFPKR
ncbi:MAG: GyrI-like domain-containing protein, partial [Phreatobacter sp.]